MLKSVQKKSPTSHQLITFGWLILNPLQKTSNQESPKSNSNKKPANA
jgi:hypothetical protein